MKPASKRPRKKVNKAEREPAKPAAEIEPVETATPANDVKARDAFGAPKGDPAWTREAMVTARTKPSFEGAEDEVKKETAKDLKK